MKILKFEKLKVMELQNRYVEAEAAVMLKGLFFKNRRPPVYLAVDITKRLNDHDNPIVGLNIYSRVGGRISYV